MTRESFETELRTLLRQRPFQPFAVELTSGERIAVDMPGALAFNNGFAVYLGAPDHVEFDCDEVVRFAPSEKAASG